MSNQPLADRMRPREYSEIVGQKHLFGENGAITRMDKNNYITNMIFYGPPGTGKTTVANIIAKKSGMQLYSLNATSASLNDVRDIISQTGTLFGAKGVLLYLDEIQYFNKKQQQSLLEYMEDGRITLIASTTENPFFYIYNAILSRSAVFEFKSVTTEDMLPALKRGLDILNTEQSKSITATDSALLQIARCAGGDVRRAINTLENVYMTADTEITRELIDAFVPDAVSVYDRHGDSHYDMLSALQKSIRGSDPDAAVFYLAKLIENGDMISACRRLQVIASEDVGLAYPLAPVMVKSCIDSAFNVGLPEARIPLANATIFLATCPKSNSAYMAYDRAMQDIENGKGITVPRLFQSRYHDEYKYPHDYPNHYVEQKYLPDDATGNYYVFGDNKQEQAAKAYWDSVKKKK
ncbi:MAG: replication-associated recombination protein A [Ruminococcaceae bacterium]|nr:replication-associated recombination protein A [Oscillospiraceae bacterium]